MEEEYFRKVMSITALAALVLLVYFLLKPLLLSIILGTLLAFIFIPIYNFIYRKTKLENVSTIIICVFLALIIILPIWFLTPMVLDESFKFFVSSQNLDLVTPLKKIFPSIFASEQFSQEIGRMLSSFITKFAQSISTSISDIILNFPQLGLQFVVVLFTFYFVLRDHEQLTDYIKSLLPFSKEVEKKLFDYTKGITYSVLYGQVVVGIFQGLIVGAGLFIFGVPNAFLLTILAIFSSILPVIGPFIVWIPTVIYLLAAGNNLAGIGMLIFGTIASTIDNILRPLIVSKRVDLPSSVILIGMVGGLFLFGILGLVLGPLILAYFLVILEIYRNKRIPGVLIEPEKK
jgi:predicted PurR-regulated permease PerM